jgi:glucans biosynthesis protein C
MITMENKGTRLYELDWLRVIVFGLLILYHAGMFFVPWEFHLKNNIIYPGLRWPMAFVNQWRLPILFIISGMGTYYALSKRSGNQFAAERFKRLFIPLAIGMAFIIPPQVYLERVSTGQFTGGYFEFWPSLAFIGTYPSGNMSWHHLWFLPYLLLYSLILLPAFLFMRRNPGNLLQKKMAKLASSPLKLFWLIIPLYLWEALLEPFFPSTHALIGDWFNLVNYLTLFFYGFLLISAREVFLGTVKRYRRLYLFLGIAGFSLQAGIWLFFEDSVLIHFIEALIKVFNIWAWILAIMGYATTYLSKPGKALSYANEAVYPFYIVHQTITLVIGFYLMKTDLGFFTEFTILVAGTFLFSWIIYEFGIRRWRLIRPLFGLKNTPQEKSGTLNLPGPGTISENPAV